MVQNTLCWHRRMLKKSTGPPITETIDTTNVVIEVENNVMEEEQAHEVADDVIEEEQVSSKKKGRPTGTGKI